MFGISKLLRDMTKIQYFVKDNLIDRKHHYSGNYELIVEKYKTREGSWAYTQGIVNCDGEEIARIKRNYSSFPFLFVGDHLICGYDYQGHTIVNLKTKEVVNELHEGADKGFGYCFSQYVASPDQKQIAVTGCVWGGPYDLVLYDFDAPKLTQNKVISDWFEGYFVEWTSEGIVESRETEVRKSDGKIVSELSDKERCECEDGEDLTEYRTFLFLWQLDGTSKKIEREFTFTGKPSGDCECFCFDVSKEEYKRIMGEEPDEFIGSRIYPGNLIQKLNIPKTSLTFTIKLT